MPADRIAALLLMCLILCLGCERPQRPVNFEPNLVHATKFQIRDDLPVDQLISDTTWLVDNLFGTPDAPKIPSVITDNPDLADVLSLDRLTVASGPIVSGRGLYRKHCANCHGVTGNGRGPQGAILNPYPRDYRMGIFKFKSTSRGSKPTRDDLAKLISGGITGTAMVKIPGLSDEDVQALVDYVIYLSIRGEFERAMISGAVNDLDLESGDRVIDVEFAKLAQAKPEMLAELKTINDDTDADELTGYEKFLAFGERLANNPELANVFEANDDDQITASAIAFVAESFAGRQALEQEILRNDPIDGQETIDDLVADNEDEHADSLVTALQESAAELIVGQHDDYKDMKEELESDADMKSRLESVSKQTTADQLTAYELYVESYEDIALGEIESLAESWLEASENIVEVPLPPAEIPVPNSHAEYLELTGSDKAQSLADSVKRGQELFVGKIASCSKCHGKKGQGDGQTNDYDDWTKDWTSRVGLKPENREALVPLLARGALPPKNAKPRNFEAGLFHGGDASADLYRRIMTGIEGSPMPAATFVEGQFEQNDVWHIINFIRSLQKSKNL